jgi:2,3-bisphosphoglycerate-independent phosphoglycerate mutase
MVSIVADVLAQHEMSTFRTAETEKYAHVTYFFNGGREEPFPREDRCLVPSKKVATYDLMPEMSAPEVTDVLCDAIKRNEHHFVLCNYANADMVGHSGSLAATIRAVETVDSCLVRVVRAAQDADAALLITADHGNAEYMIDEATGGPHTAHTCNPVPFVFVNDGNGAPLRRGGALRDVGPTILTLLGAEKPLEMTGVDLRRPDTQ